MPKVNAALIKQALTARQANQRQSTSHTKSRGNVSGGGRKPWRQKGTGRARAGSNRSPIWIGGGITFGPSNQRNFKHSLPKKMSKKAISEMLSYLLSEKKLTIVDSLSLKEAKTKLAQKLLSNHSPKGKKVIFVTGKIEPELVLATRNLPGIKTIVASDLSIRDLVVDQVVIDQVAADSFGIGQKVIKKATQKEIN